MQPDPQDVRPTPSWRNQRYARVALAIALGCPILFWPYEHLAAAPAIDVASRRVLIVIDRPNDAFMRRVMAEVAALGVAIVTVGPPRAHESLGPLEAAARREKAVAAVRMLPGRRGVEVWMADETSGRSLLRQAIVDESGGGPNEGLVAVQTAELLRTSLHIEPPPNATPLLEPTSAKPVPPKPPSSKPSPTKGAAARKNARPSGKGIGGADTPTAEGGAGSGAPNDSSASSAAIGSPPDVTPATAVTSPGTPPVAADVESASSNDEPGKGGSSGRRPAPDDRDATNADGRAADAFGPSRPANLESKSEFGAEAALGALYSPGGAGTAWQGWLSLHHSLGQSLSVALEMSAPLQGALLSGPEGSARLGTYMFGATIRMRLFELPHRWVTSVGLGGAAMHLRVEGQADPPLLAHTTTVWTGAVYMRADARFAATDWLRIGVGTMAGAAFDRVSLYFAGNDAGTWGRTFVAALVLTDFAWH